MKTLISVVLALFVVSASYAQTPDVKYIPVTLSGGTTMSARTYSMAYDDTTQGFRVGGFSKVYVHLITAANDSISVLLSCSISNDGATWSSYTLFDSLSTTGTVGVQKTFELPANAAGAELVRLRVYGSPINLASSSPSTTLTTIIRKKYD